VAARRGSTMNHPRRHSSAIYGLRDCKTRKGGPVLLAHKVSAYPLNFAH
jgi:hypothetical protein